MLAILRVSHQYDIPDARAFAVEHLDNDPECTLKPAQQLHAALTFDIRHWLRPSLRSLLSKPLCVLSASDLAVLGETVVHELILWHRHIDTERLRFLAKNFQYIAGDDCVAQDQCASRWAQMWGEFKKKVISNAGPLYKVNLRYIHNELGDREASISTAISVCSSCWKACGSPIFYGEELLSEERVMDLAVETMFLVLAPEQMDQEPGARIEDVEMVLA